MITRERGWFIYRTLADSNKIGIHYFKNSIPYYKGGKS
jgi:hypothetical protein